MKTGILAAVLGLLAGCVGSSSVNLNPTGIANRIFFLHHSTGEGLVMGGDVRGVVNAYNTAHGTSFEFWDHEYNSQGLRNASGSLTGTNFAIPGDNTDTYGLYQLWTSSEAGWTASRNQILNNFRVISFKSCFPNSAITDDAMLNEYKTQYLAMRDVFDRHTDKVFVVMSPPPLHRLATNATEAANARAFATWLASDTYLAGHSNVVCYNLFDSLAHPDDGSDAANRLRYEYEGGHNDSDSHPNATANQTVGPLMVQALLQVAVNH